jgi:hypothetical protein
MRRKATHRQALIAIFCRYNPTVTPATFDQLAPNSARIVDRIVTYIQRIERTYARKGGDYEHDRKATVFHGISSGV